MIWPFNNSMFVYSCEYLTLVVKSILQISISRFESIILNDSSYNFVMLGEINDSFLVIQIARKMK